MGKFTGTLRSNEIYGALYNMIISQQVYGDNIAGTFSKLIDAARVDGSLYGDTKLFYATDALETHAWGNDAEAANLLAIKRAPAPECQSIVLDQFRQIDLTTDDYLSKRAWSTEGAFSSFTSVLKGWIRDTKRVYDSTLYNSFIGTHKATGAAQNISWTISTAASSASEAQQIAENLADLIVSLEDVSRDFNDYGFLRSYNDGEIKVVWNSKIVNKIKKIDLPTIFHKDGLVDKFEEYVLPSRYFGNVNTAGGTTAASNTTIRSLIEKDYGDTHCFPGDLLPNSQAYSANETYTEDATIICKVLIKLPPFMSAFEVGTNFFNPKSLTTNSYLTWGYNSLDHLYNYPFITIKKA